MTKHAHEANLKTVKAEDDRIINPSPNLEKTQKI
jgi:hypothetical protein